MSIKPARVIPNMNYLSVIAITLSMSASVCEIATAADTIPVSFHGRWGTPEVCKEIWQPPIEISATRYSSLEQSCDLKKAIKSSDSYFTGSFLCHYEGETGSHKYTLELKNKKLVVNGGEQVPKCK